MWIERLMAGISHQHVLSYNPFLVYKYNIPYIKMRYVKNVLPTSKNNRKYIENQLSGAIEQMEEYIRKYPMFLVMDYV